MKEKEQNNTAKEPSWVVSLIPFVVLIAVLAVVIKVFGADALSGASQVSLLFASAIVVAISMLVYKKSWQVLEGSILENIRSIGTAILILLMIGAIAGTWMVSGIVPTLIYYGMEIITPKIFLFACCAICALISVMTGSSWTTIATIGVALIGIGAAQGYSPGWTAGAIISGAYFGDKVSPLSDTTVLASSSTSTPIFTHIRYLMITTVPTFVIALLIFLIKSLLGSTADGAQIEEVSSVLDATFNISPWLLIVPVLTAVLIAKKVPAIITLFSAALMAGMAALIAQPHIIWSIANPDAVQGFSGLNFSDAFEGTMMSIYGSTNILTGNADIDSLISTRGMVGMLNTIFLIVCSVTFGGVLTGSGMLQSLTHLLMKFVRRRIGLVSSTVGTGIFCNMATGDQYISIILTASLYKKLYEERGYEHRLLSRSVEDSATVTSVLIPWNSCGMTQATVLKVPTMEYLPYCFFNIISPLMSIFMAIIGYRIYRITKGERLTKTKEGI